MGEQADQAMRAEQEQLTRCRCFTGNAFAERTGRLACHLVPRWQAGEIAFVERLAR